MLATKQHACCIFIIHSVRMLKKLLFPLAVSILVYSSAVAQHYMYNYNVPVLQGTTNYQNPFAGGLNNPQFSSIDINQDGKKDLFLFDRSGNIPMIFINRGGTGEINYEYRAEYASRFPAMRDWAILLDYNCDGLEDIICGYDNGIKTYLAASDGGSINFTEDASKLQFTEAGFFFDLPVGYIDIPGFADIDQDGDIDVITFNMIGGIVDHYDNQAVEDGLPCGTWALEHINSCWGNFYESGITYGVDLNYDCKGIVRTADGLHAGSTFMIFDEDADNDMDVVLGDLAFDVLNKLTNGGDSELAYITDQDTTFPSYDKPYDLPAFPAPFLIDINNDGAKDMVVAPNNINSSENFKNVWYYQNISTDDTYVFDYRQDTLMVSTMLDFGDGAFPVFFDYNYDGLLDLIVGNYEYFDDGDQIGKIALLQNTGTADAPAYTLITRNLGNIADFGFHAIAPTFGDLDGDGDQDMLIGEEEGFLHLFKNIGPPEGPAEFIFFTGNYQGIDKGQNATPQLFDVNDDGLLDLILGERNGNINYFENTGTATTPVFTLISEFWGNVDVRSTGVLTGYSAPCMYRSPEGDMTLYVGCEEGTIFQYQPAADITAPFIEVTDHFSDIDCGAFSSVNINEINNDDYPDIICGNKRGGVTLFRDDRSTGIANHEAVSPLIFPNPTADNIYIDGLQKITGPILISVCSIEGKEVKSTMVSSGNMPVQLSLSDIASGVYVLHITTRQEANISSQLLIKQ